MNSPSSVVPSQQEQSSYQQQAHHQQLQQHHSQVPSPMGQHQNLEQIKEETVMESYMAGMETGEYFAQMQLQSPLLPQAPPYSIQEPQQSQHQHASSMLGQTMGLQYDYATSMADSTPLLASQAQRGYDMTSAGTSTPSTSSSSLLTSSMDSAAGYYPPFSTTPHPLYSSPPAVPSSGTFSPTLASMSGYFSQAPPNQHSQHHHQQHFYTNNAVISPQSIHQSTPPSTTMMHPENGNMFIDSGMSGQDGKPWLWDNYQNTASSSLESLQRPHSERYHSGGDFSGQFQPTYFQPQQQHNNHQHLQSPPLPGSAGGMAGFPTATTPPPLTQSGRSSPAPRPQRLFHSQSQPGLRTLHQQQKQHIQQEQQLRRRQHSVHFTSELMGVDGTRDYRSMRHVSLPMGSFSAPIPSLASLSEMMRESPSGLMGLTTDGASGADHATLLSMSLPTSSHGFSFLDNPPPPLTHRHHHHLPTSPPLMNAEASAPKSRSRAGSKSRSRPNSASSIASVRNSAAPYSPTATHMASTPSAAATGSSRSPSLVPMSPVPPLKLNSSDPDGAVPGSFDAGLVLSPGTPGSTGGKAKRISKSKTPRSRSRSSTLTASTTNAVLAAEGSSSVGLNSPFSLVLSEQDEKALQGLADKAEGGNGSPGEEDPYPMDPYHHHQQQHHQHQHGDPSSFDLDLIHEMDGSLDDSIDAEGAMDDSTGSAAMSSANAAGKPIPCPIASCPKTFTRPFNLNAHVKSHDTLKPYGCHLCPRVFSRKHDLQRHIRVHTGSKPYVCVNCQKAFARTDALCRHYKVEEACQAFMQQDEVRKHAQQQIQQQLHQEQVELQQAQQAHQEQQQQAVAAAQAASIHAQLQMHGSAQLSQEMMDAAVGGVGPSMLEYHHHHHPAFQSQDGMHMHASSLDPASGQVISEMQGEHSASAALALSQPDATSTIMAEDDSAESKLKALEASFLSNTSAMESTNVASSSVSAADLA